MTLANNGPGAALSSGFATVMGRLAGTMSADAETLAADGVALDAAR